MIHLVNNTIVLDFRYICQQIWLARVYLNWQNRKEIRNKDDGSIKTGLLNAAQEVELTSLFKIPLIDLS